MEVTQQLSDVLEKTLGDYKLTRQEIAVHTYQRKDTVMTVYHRIEGKLCARLKYHSERGWCVTGNRHKGRQSHYISLAHYLNSSIIVPGRGPHTTLPGFEPGSWQGNE